MKYDYQEVFDRCEQDYLSPPERENDCRHQSIVSSCCDAPCMFLFSGGIPSCLECMDKCVTKCNDCEEEVE